MCPSIDEYPQRRRVARLGFREEQANRGQCGAQLDVSTLLVLLFLKSQLMYVGRFELTILARNARMEFRDAQARRAIRPGSFRLDDVRSKFYDISNTTCRTDTGEQLTGMPLRITSCSPSTTTTAHTPTERFAQTTLARLGKFR